MKIRNAAWRWLWTLAGLAVIAATGWLDYYTGQHFGFSLFYLVPIALAGWFLGWSSSLVLSVAAATSWLLAEHAWHADHLLSVDVWNALTRLVVFCAMGVSLDRLRTRGLQLRAANQKLQDLLEQEARLARTDHKTGLPNSRMFIERLRGELARARRDRVPIAVLYLDLDNFKQVNDGYGHETGDQLLTRIAERLQVCLRASDIPARMGGDEFGVLLWNVDPAFVREVGNRIVNEIASLGREYPGSGLGVSVGIAHYANPPSIAEQIIRQADHCMYQAKNAGKSRVSLWTDEESAVGAERE